jgi:hypothetical protein
MDLLGCDELRWVATGWRCVIVLAMREKIYKNRQKKRICVAFRRNPSRCVAMDLWGVSLHGVQGVASSNLVAPTNLKRDI